MHHFDWLDTIADAGPILKDSLELIFNLELIKMKEFILNTNTDLCMDVKTILHSDSIAKTGKDYQGVLTKDNDEHYTFLETIPPVPEKRNPQVYRGQYITITRRDDGTYRPNFRPMKVGVDFTVEKYATGVANELLWALEGMIEK